MPASAVKKKNEKQTKKNEFPKLKTLSSVLIQSDKIEVIFKYLRAKWQRLRDNRVLAISHSEGNHKKFCLLFKLKKLAFLLLYFYDAAKAAKKRFLKLTEHSKLSSFANMIT